MGIHRSASIAVAVVVAAVALIAVGPSVLGGRDPGDRRQERVRGENRHVRPTDGRYAGRKGPRCHPDHRPRASRRPAHEGRCRRGGRHAAAARRRAGGTTARSSAWIANSIMGTTMPLLRRSGGMAAAHRAPSLYRRPARPQAAAADELQHANGAAPLQVGVREQPGTTSGRD